ncbi:MAG: inorganic diphosphatase [Patescibacteria group bacterium]
MNLWHEVTRGKNIPEEFNCIIEIPKGSNNKYEIDKDTGMIKLDRANYGPTAYPFDYGFVPQTLWEDGDALDVLVLSTYPIPSGILVNVRPVGIMEMIDSGESDSKIIAVPIDDQRWEDVKDLKDINKHSLREFADFFQTYKALKAKQSIVTVHGFKDKAAAIEAIHRSITLYEEKFGK